ncbi:MAG: hypothetical protein IPM92_03935 [Saprospiraceae bacterium]|nr:hypothetical protein [Saprospiraceae bacterium]
MRILYLILFAFTCFFLHAQNYEKLNGPYGGGSKVYEGKNGVLFQFLEGNKLFYRSTDNGTTWRFFSFPTNATYYQVEIGGDGQLYYLVFSDLYKSTNDGLSWSKLNLPANTLGEKITALQDGTLILYGDNQIFTSANNGLTWIQTGFIGQVKRFFPSQIQDWVFAISSQKLWLSKDKGSNWNEFYVDDFGNEQFCFAEAANSNILLAGNEFIWRWDTSANLMIKTNILRTTNSSVHMALGNSGRLFAYEDYRTYYSDDLGVQWKSFPINPAYPSVFHSLAATSGNVVFGVRQYGSLYKSTDNGLSWNFSAYGMQEANIFELDFIAARQFTALTNDGIFYTEDDGKNWDLIARSKSTLGDFNRNNISLVGSEIFYMDGAELYYLSNPKSIPQKRTHALFNQGKRFNIHSNRSTSSIFVYDLSEIHRSDDKGQSWTNLQLPGVIQMYDFPNGHLIAATAKAVFRSEDNGLSWTQVFDFPTNVISLFSIAGNAFNTAYILSYNSTGNQMYYSDDNGQSWSLSTMINQSNGLFGFLSRFASTNTGRVFIPSSVAGDRVYASTPDRRNLQAFGDVLESISGTYIGMDQKLYITAIGLYRSILPVSTSKVLQGISFSDANKNCQQDPGEAVLPNAMINATSANEQIVVFSDANGKFYVPLNSGDYTLEVNSKNNYWKSCKTTIQSAQYNFANTLYLGVSEETICPYLEVDAQTSLFRRCFESDIIVRYTNSGTATATNAYVDVVLDDSLDYVSSSIALSSQNGRVFRFELGDLSKLSVGEFSIRVQVNCNSKLGDVHCVEAHIFPDSLCIPSSFAQIRTDAECLGDSIKLIIRNEGNADMTLAKSWFVADMSNSSSSIDIFDSGTFLLGAGQEFTKTILSRARVLLSAEQDELYPNNQHSTTEIISCLSNPGPGLPPLRITNLDEDESFISKFCIQNRGSYDPNDITGFPQGLTDKKFIDTDQELEYIIRFQNTGTDTAFSVRIENQIRKDLLDLSSFIAGASSHPYNYLVTPEGKLIFSFSNIQLPDSNINEKASHGFLQYRIKPVQKLWKGTKVYNDAEIFFDFNAGVKTNLEYHTLGLPIPVNTKNVLNQSFQEFNLSPNPAITETRILWTKEVPSPFYYLHIYNDHGQKVYERKIYDISRNIPIKDLQQGIYHLIVQSNTGEILGSGKLIKK